MPESPQPPAAFGVLAAIVLVARRELQIIRRSRSHWVILALVALIVWLPPFLISLRAGVLGVASFEESTSLALALGGTILPLLALLFGAETLAGELEDGSLLQVLTLPISRTACITGKVLARAALFSGCYSLAATGLMIVMTVAKTSEGLRDYAAVSVSGMLLGISCIGCGALMSSTVNGRTRAIGLALGTWAVFVFALDAVILALVVAVSPIPPDVGHRGHEEIAPPDHAHHQTHQDHQTHQHHQATPQKDPHSHGAGGDAVTAEADNVPWPTWLMLLDPVDLFRLSVLGGAPSLRAHFITGLTSRGGLWFPVTAGWLMWLGLPFALAVRRFKRLDLRTG